MEVNVKRIKNKRSVVTLDEYKQQKRKKFSSKRLVLKFYKQVSFKSAMNWFKLTLGLFFLTIVLGECGYFL